MGATFSRVKTWSEGETLTASQLNAEFNNILNNLDPTGIDDESANDAAAQATSDPYSGSSLTKAISLEEEIQQLRYLIAQITGETYWYIDPDNDIATIHAALIEAGTIMLFGQNSAPTGWTRKTDWQDNAMLCYAASGNINGGGSVNPQSTHTHTGPSHTHTTGNHTLSIAEIPSHTHIFTGSFDGTAEDACTSGDFCTPWASSQGNSVTVPASGGGGAHNHGATGAGGTGATGANTAPHYQEVIAATKD